MVAGSDERRGLPSDGRAVRDTVCSGELSDMGEIEVESNSEELVDENDEFLDSVWWWL